MENSKDQQQGVATALKEQLLLISSLVLFAGIVSTDTYYAAFGLRYQFLDIASEHLLYRGVVALTDNFWLAASYIVAISWLAAGASLARARFLKRTEAVEFLTYILLVALAAVAYFAAISEGRSQAARDLSSRTSSLPTIQAIKGEKESDLPFTGFRVLLAGKDSIAVFKPSSSAAEVPFIHILKRDDVHELVLLR